MNTSLRPAVLVCAVFLVLSMLSSAGYAETVAGVSGGSNGGYEVGGNFPQYVATSWTSSNSFYDVSISVSMYRGLYPQYMGTAYLTNSLGPGTTGANVLGSSVIDGSLLGNCCTTLTLFSGLNLGPGTYYLVLAAPKTSDDMEYFGWQYNDGIPAPSFTTAAGVTLGHDYYVLGQDLAFPPEGNFLVLDNPVIFEVSGNAVPEPSSLLLLGSGLVGAAGAIRRKLGG